jgi:hypothetical protein
MIFVQHYLVMLLHKYIDFPVMLKRIFTGFEVRISFAFRALLC